KNRTKNTPSAGWSQKCSRQVVDAASRPVYTRYIAVAGRYWVRPTASLQCRRPERDTPVTWKRFLLLGALLGAVALAFGFFWPFRPRTDLLRLPGVVETQEVRLGSKIGGRVETVAILEGAIAMPGQVLVSFEVPELKAQRQQVQARLEAAEAELEKAQNGPRPEEKEAGRRAVESAQARLKRLQVSMQEELRAAQSEL